MTSSERTIGDIAADWTMKAFHAVQESGRQWLSEKEEQAAFEEYERGLNRAVAALSEVTNDKEAMAKALHRHWGVEISEAEDRVQWEMRVNAPARNLERFLQMELNFSKSEARSYMKEKMVRIRLKNDRRLSALKPKELYRELEKVTKR